VRVTSLVEKPAPGTAPSNLAVIGRYVLRPEIFDILEHTQPGKGGEIQLTDALLELAGDTEHGGVYGVVFRGRRYDTGDRLDYIKAIVQLAVERATWARSCAPGCGSSPRAWTRRVASIPTLRDGATVLRPIRVRDARALEGGAHRPRRRVITDCP